MFPASFTHVIPPCASDNATFESPRVVFVLHIFFASGLLKESEGRTQVRHVRFGQSADLIHDVSLDSLKLRRASRLQLLRNFEHESRRELSIVSVPAQLNPRVTPKNVEQGYASRAGRVERNIDDSEAFSLFLADDVPRMRIFLYK